MKNITKKMLLVLAVLWCENSFAENLFRSFDFGMKLDLQVPFIAKETKNSKAKDNYKISGHTGFTVRFRDAQVRLYDGFENVPFLLESAKAKTIANLKNIQYGALFSFGTFTHFPLTIKAGTLSFSELVSEMNAPTLSETISAASKYFSKCKKIRAALPTLSSSNKNFGTALDMRAPRSAKHFSKSGGSFFWDTANRFAFEGDFIYTFDNLLEIGGSLSMMRFPLEVKKAGKNSKTWFTKSGFYHAGNFFTAEAQTFFYSPYFATRVFCNWIQQPVLCPRFTFGNEAKISVAGFVAHTEVFFADGKDIVKADNNLLKKLYQWKVKANYTFRFPSERFPSLTIGAGIFEEKNYEFKYTHNEPQYIFHEPMKVNAELRYQDRWISASLLGEIGEIHSGKNTYGAKANFSYKKGKVHPSLSVSYNAKKTNKTQTSHGESVKISLVFPRINEKFFVSTKLEMEQKEKKQGKQTLSFGFGFLKKQKHASYKFSFSFVGVCNEK